VIFGLDEARYAAILDWVAPQTKTACVAAVATSVTSESNVRNARMPSLVSSMIVGPPELELVDALVAPPVPLDELDALVAPPVPLDELDALVAPPVPLDELDAPVAPPVPLELEELPPLEPQPPSVAEPETAPAPSVAEMKLAKNRRCEGCGKRPREREFGFIVTMIGHEGARVNPWPWTHVPGDRSIWQPTSACPRHPDRVDVPPALRAGRTRPYTLRTTSAP
jgi:hypothetical protein